MTRRDFDDREIEGALRRAGDEARPREEFRRRLREAFVDGTLAAPSDDGEPDDFEPLPEPRLARRDLPRWVAYPLAAAFAAGLLVVTGALDRGAEPEPLLPSSPKTPPAEAAQVAAERRLQASPDFAGRPWRRLVVEGRPVLLPSERAFGEAADLASLCAAMGRAEKALGLMLPGAAKRPALPTVLVVAPSRANFRALVGPLTAPAPVEDSTVAFAHRGLGVLLLSPGALDPGGTPCEEMDIAHEAVHAWLRARQAGAAPLPLWLEEGLAGAVSEGNPGATRDRCRRLLGSVRTYGVDPVVPSEILSLRTYSEAARVVAECAPCSERPFTMLAAFHAHAESLVLFLLGEEGAPAPRGDAFRAWVARALDGERTGPTATAKALGFESPEALLAARDGWLGL